MWRLDHGCCITVLLLLLLLLLLGVSPAVGGRPWEPP
jgi:hypothetical protein